MSSQGEQRACPEHPGTTGGHPQGGTPTDVKLSLPDIVNRFKSLTSNRYIRGIRQNKWTPFNDKLWQRNCHEHVIRKNIDLAETREYIMNNPKKWHLDKYYPAVLEDRGK